MALFIEEVELLEKTTLLLPTFNRFYRVAADQ
jgi:hypothetical protein